MKIRSQKIKIIGNGGDKPLLIGNRLRERMVMMTMILLWDHLLDLVMQNHQNQKISLCRRQFLRQKGIKRRNKQLLIRHQKQFQKGRTRKKTWKWLNVLLVLMKDHHRALEMMSQKMYHHLCQQKWQRSHGHVQQQHNQPIYANINHLGQHHQMPKVIQSELYNPGKNQTINQRKN